MAQEASTGGLQRSFRLPDFASPGVITRERSFVRQPSHHQGFGHHHQVRDGGKRRSMIVTTSTRGKPTMEIYRPPSVRVDGAQNNKLNVHAKEFTMARHQEMQARSAMNIQQMYGGLQHSKSSGNILHQMNARGPAPALYQAPVLQHPQPSPQHLHQQHHQHQPHLPHLPLLTSTSSGNILHSAPRVHFKLHPQQQAGAQAAPHDKKKSPPLNGQGEVTLRARAPPQPGVGLKRSKSLTTTDTLASGMAALGLTAPDAMDLGTFPAEVQDTLDKAIKDPNQLSARTLMDLVGHIMRRAVESPRYALPAARHCLLVIERERTQTFLESLLNTCQQWYQEREKILCVLIGGGRPKLMAFISLLLELFCQLRRRGPAGGAGGGVTPPARALLALICKCCEECIRAPVPSASDTENLFFILTYIGRDLETQLPGDLEKLLTAVRDAFLNTQAAPSITKTLLQLIELHASHWQLPGGAVLYYYPSTK